VVPAGVRGVDHRVDLGSCAGGPVEQRPGLVEQVHCEPPVVLRRKPAGFGRSGACGRCRRVGHVISLSAVSQGPAPAPASEWHIPATYNASTSVNESPEHRFFNGPIGLPLFAILAILFIAWLPAFLIDPFATRLVTASGQ
jgi:hypothetical protein